MKRYLQRFLALMMVLWTSSQLSAQSFTDGGINYKVLSEADKTCEVGNGYYKGDIIIPEKVTYNGAEYTVKSIGQSAFSGSRESTSVTLPESIENIGEHAFYGCEKITSINLPESIRTIGAEAFRNCHSLTSSEIPEGITSLPNGIFRGCNTLTSVKLPESLTSIGEFAFGDCYSLLSVNLSESITSIEMYAFMACMALTSVDLPQSIKVINRNTFERCRVLSSITLPEALTTIGEEAFQGCWELTIDKFPVSLTSIGKHAFRECKSLATSIDLPNLTSIGDEAFASCETLESFKFSSSLTTIGNYAFSNCKSLTSVDLSNSTATLGSGIFSSCKSLTEVKLPASLSKIENGMFSDCELLNHIDLPSSITTIEDYAFRDCKSLKAINFPENLTNIGNQSFSNCSELASVVLPEKVTTIGEFAFYKCTSLSLIDLSADLTTLKGAAFSDCPEINTIVMRSVKPQDISTKFSYPDLYNKATLKIPNGTLSAYVATEPWSSFLTIESIEGEKVTLGETTAEVIAGNSVQLTATVTGGSGNTVTWTSDDESIATVDATGKVTGVAEGEVLIRATSNAARSTCTVTVKVIHAEKIELNETKCSLEKGKTLELMATITPAEHSDKVTWTSSDENVATVTVDENGKVIVKGIGAGKAVIKVTAGNVSASCEVTVVIPATEITLDKTETTMEKGATLTLTPSVTPEDTTDELVWASDNEEVAKVVDGVVTAVDKGEANITVTAGNVSATCKVTVVISATAITLDPTEATIEKGETLTLTPSVTPEDTTDELVWTSEDENIATVDENGVVTALAVGTTKITVTAGKVSASCDVTVVISAKEIDLDKDEATIEKGETLTLTPTVVPENTTDKLVWTSEDENIATVDENGVVTAVAVGTTKITVTAGKVSASCQVTVVISATDITLDPTEATIEKGETLTLTPSVTPEDTTDELVWTSEDENIATVDENGVVTALAVGTTKITVTAGKVSASCNVTVVISMTGIELDKTEAEGYIGGTIQLTATVKPDDTTDDTTVTWTSSDENVATVDENGLVSCLAEGETVITATCGEFSAECTVTVTDRPPFVGITSFELSATEVELALNFTYSLFGVFTPENATDTELEWSTSNPDVARVYEGVVYGIVPGEAVITARTTDGSNLSASCKFTIVATSGIEGTEGDTVKVTAAASVITVKGATMGATVEVYSMNGACVAVKTVESSVEELPVAASGIYVVRVDGKTFKVAL